MTPEGSDEVFVLSCDHDGGRRVFVSWLDMSASGAGASSAPDAAAASDLPALAPLLQARHDHTPTEDNFATCLRVARSMRHVQDLPDGAHLLDQFGAGRYRF